VPMMRSAVMRTVSLDSLPMSSIFLSGVVEMSAKRRDNGSGLRRYDNCAWRRGWHSDGMMRRRIRKVLNSGRDTCK
jgi:hypothetical protein